MKCLILLPVLLPILSTWAGPASVPSFRAEEIDSSVGIGYGLAIADVDGDNRDDILLVDKDNVSWYRNPSWKKHRLTGALTRRDHVCIAARDLDGDGKAEVAVGAEWNPGDTVGSGAVFYLVPPADRTQEWEAVPLPHEPVVHRMHWMRNRDGQFDLVVLPLHGRGNRNGQGAGVRILAYTMPEDPRQTWKTEVINDDYHLTHNFDVVDLKRENGQEGLVVAAKEALPILIERSEGWRTIEPIIQSPAGGEFSGAGEVRLGHLGADHPFLASIEPMHGNQVVIYTRIREDEDRVYLHRNVIDDTLVEGHAVACGDLLHRGGDQVVVGWRSMRDPNATVGIKIFVPVDREGREWQSHLIDDHFDCEDLKLVDLNGDGWLDIVAAGRATHNLKIYFNEGSSAPPSLP